MTESLRDRLFNAVLHRPQDLKTLCTQHAQDVLGQFSAWQELPEPIRGDPVAVRAWGECLVAIATCMQDFGFPEPWQSLYGEIDDVVQSWVNTFERAQRLSDSGVHAAARDELTGLLGELGHAQGSVADDIRPKVLGLLGTNACAGGDIDEARRWNDQALSECEAIGDRDGVRTYRENAELLELLALSRANPDEAARIIACRRAITQAQDLSDDGECERSTEILTAVLADIDRGSTTQRYRAKVLGQLGWNAVRTGDLGTARRCTELALSACHAGGDEDGVRIYSANLAEIGSRERAARPARSWRRLFGR